MNVHESMKLPPVQKFQVCLAKQRIKVWNFVTTSKVVNHINCKTSRVFDSEKAYSLLWKISNHITATLHIVRANQTNNLNIRTRRCSIVKTSELQWATRNKNMVAKTYKSGHANLQTMTVTTKLHLKLNDQIARPHLFQHAGSRELWGFEQMTHGIIQESATPRCCQALTTASYEKPLQLCKLLWHPPLGHCIKCREGGASIESSVHE